MSDNVTITPGTGVAIAADDVAGVLFQRIKMTFGTDGVADDVTLLKPIPVAGADRVLSVLGPVLTRPANVTPYSVNDAISNHATPASVVALPVIISDLNDAPVVLVEIELDTNDTGLAAGVQIDVFVYNQDPTANSGVGGGDNSAFANKRAGFRARFRGTFLAFSDGGKATCIPIDGAGNPIAIAPIMPETSGKQLWLQYKVLNIFVPSAINTTITPRLKGFQNRA